MSNMTATTPIFLDFNRPNYVTAYAVQNDRSTRVLRVRFADNGTAWTMPAGASLTVRYKKPDGTSGWYDTLEDGSTPCWTANADGSVTVALAEQAITCPGIVALEIGIYGANEERLSAAQFRLVVAPSPCPDEEIESSDYFNVLTEDFSAALNALREAQAFVGAPLTARYAVDMTDTSRIYVYTGAEPDMDVGYWYYFNGTDWTEGGPYNSVAVLTDKGLTLPDVPADAAAVGARYDRITERTNNLVDETVITAASGVTTDANGWIIGTQSRFYEFDLRQLGIPGITFASGTRYTLSLNWFCTDRLSSTTTMSVGFLYSDNSQDVVMMLDTPTSASPGSATITSAEGKTVIRCGFLTGSTDDIVKWHLRNIMLNTGTSAAAYVPREIANDTKARTTATQANARAGTALDVADRIMTAMEQTSAAEVTEGLCVTNTGVTVYRAGANRLGVYGTATNTRRFTFLNGNTTVKTTGADFLKTLPPGTYQFSAYEETGTKSFIIDYTETTFSGSAVHVLVSDENPYASVTFERPVMIGLRSTNGADFGTENDPLLLTLSVWCLTAVDSPARDECEDLSSLANSSGLIDLTAFSWAYGGINSAGENVSNSNTMRTVGYIPVTGGRTLRARFGIPPMFGVNSVTLTIHQYARGSSSTYLGPASISSKTLVAGDVTLDAETTHIRLVLACIASPAQPVPAEGWKLVSLMWADGDLARIEDGGGYMAAGKVYSVGQYISIGHRLFRATANIATNELLVPDNGGNCVEVDVATALNALLAQLGS